MPQFANIDSSKYLSIALLSVSSRPWKTAISLSFLLRSMVYPDAPALFPDQMVAAVPDAVQGRTVQRSSSFTKSNAAS